MTLIRGMNMDFFFASLKEEFYCFAGCRVVEIIQIIRIWLEKNPCLSVQPVSSMC